MHLPGNPWGLIHPFISVIPRPRKKGKNVSDYDESFVERILLIKQIQDHFFLPLSLIKKIVKQRNKFPEMKSLLELRIGYFSPLDQFIQKEVVGEEAVKFVRQSYRHHHPREVPLMTQWSAIYHH